MKRYADILKIPAGLGSLHALLCIGLLAGQVSAADQPNPAATDRQPSLIRKPALAVRPARDEVERSSRRKWVARPIAPAATASPTGGRNSARARAERPASLEVPVSGGTNRSTPWPSAFDASRVRQAQALLPATNQLRGQQETSPSDPQAAPQPSWDNVPPTQPANQLRAAPLVEFEAVARPNQLSPKDQDQAPTDQAAPRKPAAALEKHPRVLPEEPAAAESPAGDGFGLPHNASSLTPDLGSGTSRPGDRDSLAAPLHELSSDPQPAAAERKGTPDGPRKDEPTAATTGKDEAIHWTITDQQELQEARCVIKLIGTLGMKPAERSAATPPAADPADPAPQPAKTAGITTLPALDAVITDEQPAVSEEQIAPERSVNTPQTDLESAPPLASELAAAPLPVDRDSILAESQSEAPRAVEQNRLRTPGDRSLRPAFAAREGAPTEGEPTEGEPTEDEPTEDEPTEDEPTEDEPTEDEPSEDEPGEDLLAPPVVEPFPTEKAASDLQGRASSFQPSYVIGDQSRQEQQPTWTAVTRSEQRSPAVESTHGAEAAEAVPQDSFAPPLDEVLADTAPDDSAAVDTASGASGLATPHEATARTAISELESTDATAAKTAETESYPKAISPEAFHKMPATEVVKQLTADDEREAAKDEPADEATETEAAPAAPNSGRAVRHRLKSAISQLVRSNVHQGSAEEGDVAEPSIDETTPADSLPEMVAGPAEDLRETPHDAAKEQTVVGPHPPAWLDNAPPVITPAAAAPAPSATVTNLQPRVGAPSSPQGNSTNRPGTAETARRSAAAGQFYRIRSNAPPQRSRSQLPTNPALTQSPSRQTVPLQTAPVQTAPVQSPPAVAPMTAAPTNRAPQTDELVQQRWRGPSASGSEPQHSLEARTRAPQPPKQLPLQVTEVVGLPSVPPNAATRPDAPPRRMPEVRLAVRTSYPLRAPGRVSLATVVDRSVCEVVQHSPYEIALVGKQEGQTDVAIWLDGERSAQLYRVVVGGGETAMQSEGKLERLLTELFPRSGVRLTPRDGTVLVDGVAKDRQEAIQILSVIRSVKLVPVVDNIQVRRRR